MPAPNAALQYCMYWSYHCMQLLHIMQHCNVLHALSHGALQCMHCAVTHALQCMQVQYPVSPALAVCFVPPFPAPSASFAVAYLSCSAQSLHLSFVEYHQTSAGVQPLPCPEPFAYHHCLSLTPRRADSSCLLPYWLALRKADWSLPSACCHHPISARVMDFLWKQYTFCGALVALEL